MFQYFLAKRPQILLAIKLLTVVGILAYLLSTTDQVDPQGAATQQPILAEQQLPIRQSADRSLTDKHGKPAPLPEHPNGWRLTSNGVDYCEDWKLDKSDEWEYQLKKCVAGVGIASPSTAVVAPKSPKASEATNSKATVNSSSASTEPKPGQVDMEKPVKSPTVALSSQEDSGLPPIENEPKKDVRAVEVDSTPKATSLDVIKTPDAVSPTFAPISLSSLGVEERQSIESACYLPKANGPAAYNRCLQDQLSELSRGVRRPNLSSLGVEERQSIETACYLPKANGPATYNRCLQGQLADLSRSPSRPNLSSLGVEERQSIETACYLPKASGPATYNRCLQGQLADLSRGPSRPNLSSLGVEERQSIETACYLPKASGPATYNRCLQDQLSALSRGPRRPDLSFLGAAERQSIETACYLPKASGPATYNRCLQDQVAKLGRKPNN